MLPDLQINKHALFLDLDGTLAEIAPTPQDAFIPANILKILPSLQKTLGQALAIVSGRSLSDIDHLTGCKFIAAGQHGLEIRYADGHVMQVESAQLLQPVKEAALALQQRHPNLLLEYKSMGLAIHYRQAPEQAELVQSTLSELIANHPELHLQQGKMVCEVRLSGADKGSAICELMQETPFKGRIPIFIGDDVTDESGFAAVNSLGGISVKLGAGATAAQLRADNVQQIHSWLLGQAERIAQDRRDV